MSQLYVVVLAIIVAVLLAVAIYRTSRVKTKADYLVAGRSLPAVVLVLTLLTSWIGAGSLFAGAENAYRNGFAALWLPAGGWLGLLLIYFIAPRARKFAQFTLPDLLETRYNQTARVLGTLAILFAYVGITSYQFKGGGNVLHLIFPDQVSPNLGTWIIAVFVIVTTALAGMSSVAYMDVVIGSLVTVICIIATPWLLHEAGGWAGLHAVLPETHFEVLGNLTFLRAMEFLVPTLMLMLGNQVMYQKFFSARSEKDARISVVGWIVGTVVLETLIVAIAVFGSAMYRTGEVLNQPYEIIPYTARHGLPALMGAILLGAVFAKVISTASNYLFSPASNLIEDVYVRYISRGRFQQAGPRIFPAGGCLAWRLGALPGPLRSQHPGKNALGLHHLFRCADAGGAGRVLLPARDGVGRRGGNCRRHSRHAGLGLARFQGDVPADHRRARRHLPCAGGERGGNGCGEPVHAAAVTGPARTV